MPDSDLPFSKREGHSPIEQPITIREDAPENFRYALLELARGECALQPKELRSIICGVVQSRPDPSNWSDYPNVWGEVEDHVYRCQWYHVYDFAERIYRRLTSDSPQRASKFEDSLNSVFREMGMGWRMVSGVIITRGEEAVEAVQKEAASVLEEVGLTTAGAELHEAIRDLSRRPEPDLSGAIQHAMASLECVARVASGDTRRTLGEIIKKYPGLIPPPLDDSVSKAWGYASNEARHGKEERELTREEAQLIVGLSAVVSTYIAAKLMATD